MTDAESFRSCIGSWGYGEFVPAFFARTLERQLAEARENEAAMSQIAASCQCPEKDGDIALLKWQLAEAKEATQAAHKLLHAVRRDHSDGMNLAAYECIQEAINHLTP